ncbi:hypothetical protein [Clostridium perfringens]|uniref:Uncharacterized protein n=1 Tax=Clostridium perfringens TaxID=1502 RepID=A0ABD4PNJ5_CLOPF|nr:hypothetical protein [Clostridium perfringens]MBO3416804.1 hypothetical protein [Clostridium perfringens]
MDKLKCPRYKNEYLKEKTALRKLTQEQSESINTGSKTINLIREEYALEPIKDGDKSYHKIIL